MLNSKISEIINNKKYQIIFIVALVFISIAGKPIAKVLQGKEITPVDTTPQIVEPSLTNKTLVENLISLDINKADKNQLRDYFLTLSDVVKTEPGLIKTTGQFREFNITAGGLNFAGLELKNKYPNLGEEIDGAITAAVGKENTTLTPEKRSNLSKVLQAIAWSVQ